MSLSEPGHELLYRQVNPAHWDGQNPNSQAFFPTPQHQDKLSVDDGMVVGPDESYRHFTQDLGLKSAGTWAVSRQEMANAGGLILVSDPIVGQPDPKQNNPAHCLIDFGKLSTKGEKKRKAQALAIKASERGCQYSPA